MIVTTLSKVAARKFLTGEGLAYEIEMTSNTMSKYLIAQLQYVKQSWVKGGGERYKRKQAAR